MERCNHTIMERDSLERAYCPDPMIIKKNWDEGRKFSQFLAKRVDKEYKFDICGQPLFFAKIVDVTVIF